MVLNAEKRRHLVVVAAQKKNAPGLSVLGPSAPCTSAPGPFAPGPKDKRLKGVAEVADVAPSEDDETFSGLVFKRKHKVDAAIPVPSDSDGRAPSYRESPLSASSPHDVVVHGGRGESASEED